MSLIFKDKSLRKEVLIFTIPFFIQEIIINLTGFLSSFMVNPFVSEGVRTGINAAGRIHFLLSMTVGAMVFIGNLFISQHFGEKKMNLVSKDFHLALKIVAVINILFFIVSISIPEQLISLFIPGQTEGIMYGTEYLRIFSVTFLLTGFSLIYYCLMKNTGLEKFASINSIVTLGVLAATTAIFMFGCNIGVAGIAIALIITRFIELAFNVIVVQIKGKVKFSFKEFFTPNRKLFVNFFKHGGPLTLGKLSWAFGFIAVGIVMGQLHNGPISDAHGIVGNVLGMVMCIPNSITATLGVSIGRRLGADKLDEAKDASKQILKLTSALSILSVIIFLAAMPIVLAIHNPSTGTKQETYDYIWKFFLIIAITFIPRTHNGPIENGVLNAGGDTLYVSILDGLAAWVVVIPLGVIGIRCNWNPLATYAVLQLEEVVKFPINIWRYKTGKWIRNITKNKIDLGDVVTEQPSKNKK